MCFAHSFAYEGEHEHAITAYATTARLFPGCVDFILQLSAFTNPHPLFVNVTSSYLPVMCIGMEYIQLNDMPMALNVLNTALGFGVKDPLLYNEIGIVHFNQGQ